MKLRRRQRWTAIFLAAAIAVASLLRGTHFGEPWHVGGMLHLVTHICLFALLTALFTASTNSWAKRSLFFAVVVLLGLGTEFYEHLRDGYPIETQDVLADTAGAALALMLTSAFIRTPGSGHSS